LKNTKHIDVNTAGDATLHSHHLAGGIIARDPNGGSRTDTTARAPSLMSSFGFKDDGDTGSCVFVNTAGGDENITIAAGDGVTIVNPGRIIRAGEAVTLLFRRTSATSVTCYIIA
jgi:hypothetical protein